MFGQIGGVIGLILPFVSLFVRFFSNKIYQMVLLSRLYVVNDREDSNSDNKEKSIKVQSKFNGNKLESHGFYFREENKVQISQNSPVERS
jgi:allophanate hydrolase subunit 1